MRESGPGRAGVAHGEHRESLEVGRRAQQREVGLDAVASAHSRPPPAVTALHEVSDLTLDFRSNRPVVLFPLLASLTKP